MQLLDEPMELGAHAVRIGASVGIAIFPEDATQMEQLCIAADLRMYDAKHESHQKRGQDGARTARLQPRLETHTPAGLQAVESGTSAGN
jgi:predicted signal transduction protein with EAL and GGDEF domain